MKDSYSFLSLILDSIPDHIAVIDEKGKIQYANKSWSSFGESNACVLGDDWIGVNYIEECEKAAAMGDAFGLQAYDGIRNVIEKGSPGFYFEYPCHSPDEKRWFMMRVTPFQISGGKYFVISHQNITERKLSEEKVKELARMDGLTNIPNRRTLDAFLHEEWRRCARLKKPISMALIDLDHFKTLNDNYGHQYGDECLIKIAGLLKEFANRPSDICARYGGEEFALVWGDTSLEQARQLSDRLLKKIAELQIQNEYSPVSSTLSVSIGLAEMVPDKGRKRSQLIAEADRLLYIAKGNGRNRVES